MSLSQFSENQMKPFSVLKQNAVGFGRIYIRGIASRLYLCINECGRLYGSV
ncbi:Fibroblast growth factor 16, partial [Daphnia magna]